MDAFASFSSRCLPIRTENIDTDQIVPARFLKTTVRKGISRYLFYSLRFGANGQSKDSIFSDPRYTGARILVVGNNFGCGSSREHAVWAIQDYGFDAVLSSSFGDIFYTNALKNGLLPVVLSHEALDRLLELVALEPAITVTIDLDRQSVLIPSASLTFTFPIDPFQKMCLITGVDELGYLLSLEKKIRAFERQREAFFHHSPRGYSR